MPVRLRSNNVFSSAGSKAAFSLIYNHVSTPSLVPGNTVFFETDIFSITLTCAAIPDNSGTQFRPKAVGQTPEQYMNQLYADLSQNYLLTTHYVMSKYYFTWLGLYSVIFTARENGEMYNLNNYAVTSGRFGVGTQAGTDKTRRPNFKINLQVWKKDTVNGDKMIGEDALSPDINGDCYFDIAEYCRPLLKSSFKYPEDTLNANVYVRPDMSFPYYIRYNEQYGAPPTDYSIADSNPASPLYVLGGNIDDHELREKYIRNTHSQPIWNVFRPQFNQGLLWLTNQPNKKQVRRWSIEKLYFLCQPNVAAAQVRVKVTKNDSTTSEYTLATISQPHSKVYEFGVGYKALRFDTIFGPGIVKSWEVYVRRSDTLAALTTRRVYSLKQTPELHERQLMFLNRLGGYDTVILTGDQSAANEYQRSSGKLIDNHPNPFIRNVTEVLAPEKQYKVTANTGHLSKAQHKHIRELFDSKEIYEIIDNKLFPCEIVSDSIPSNADRVGARNVSFEYTRSEGDQTKGGVGDMSIDFNFLIQ